MRWVFQVGCHVELLQLWSFVHMLQIRWLWRIEPSVIYIWRAFGILTSSVSWIIGLVNFVFDPLLNLHVVWKGVCVLPSGLSSPRNMSSFFCLEQYDVCQVFFFIQWKLQVWYQGYKVWTSFCHNGVHWSIDLNIVHNDVWFYSFVLNTSGIFVYVPASVIISVNRTYGSIMYTRLTKMF